MNPKNRDVGRMIVCRMAVRLLWARRDLRRAVEQKHVGYSHLVYCVAQWSEAQNCYANAKEILWRENQREQANQSL